MFRGLQEVLSGYITEVRRFFRMDWEPIATHNLHMLRVGIGVATTLLIAFLAVSVWMGRPLEINLLYGACLVTQLALYAGIKAQGARLRWRTRVIGALCMGWLLLCWLDVVYIGTVGMPGEPDVYYAPLTLSLSMVFILPPWRTMTIVTVVSGCFILLSSLSKAPALFLQDFNAALLCWGLCLVVNIELMNIRMRDERMRSELTRLCRTDSLTGLMNKNTTEEAARAYLNGSAAREQAALFVIDLDQFKQINDQMGHLAGDEALEIVGDTLRKLFRGVDIVGRVGGDEFVAVLKDARDRRVVERRAAQICETVRNTCFERGPLQLTCSVGVALNPAQGNTYETLFRMADEQLYLVKRSGKNGYRIAHTANPH